MNRGRCSGFAVGSSHDGVFDISHILFAYGTSIFCGAKHISSSLLAVLVLML